MIMKWCKELSAEILKANQYADEAQQAKTGTPHNIGLYFSFYRVMELH